ncbi:hypothetical protein [Kitasatospora sp. NPDC093558]|uniref:hypothetical protein n=1 Tax=Kitasatospora sp. NPDC093558 TaxID=3155201 RepID=UPI0034225DFB
MRRAEEAGWRSRAASGWRTAAAAAAAAGTLLFRLIPYLMIGAFGGGIALALVMRWRRPELYARMGRIVLEDAAERS